MRNRNPPLQVPQPWNVDQAERVVVGRKGNKLPHLILDQCSNEFQLFDQIDELAGIDCQLFEVFLVLANPVVLRARVAANPAFPILSETGIQFPHRVAGQLVGSRWLSPNWARVHFSIRPPGV